MSDADFIIRIRALLEKGDFAAAQTELAKLESTVKSSAFATGQNAASFADMRSKMEAARMATFSLDQALQGNVHAITNLFMATSRFSGLLGRLGMVGLWFSTGWTVGKVILHTAEQFRSMEKEIEKTVGSTRNVRGELEGLNQVKLATLEATLSSLETRLARTLKAIQVATGRKTETEANAAEADVAAAGLNMPAGPERDRAIIKREALAEEAKLVYQRSGARQQISAADPAKNKASEELAGLTAERDRTAATLDAALSTPEGRTVSEKGRRAERVEWHLLKLLLGLGGKPIFAAWVGHQRVGFWPAFADPRLGAIRAEGDSVFSEDLKELVEETGLFARLV